MDHSDAWVSNGCSLADPLLAKERLALVASYTRFATLWTGDASLIR